MMLATDSGAQEPPVPSNVLDEGVIAQALHHVANAPVAVLPPLSSRSTIVAKGNFGRAIYSDSTASFTRLEDGLYDVQESARLAPNLTVGEGAGSTSSSLSLCGLVVLFSAGNSQSVNKVFTTAAYWIYRITSSVEFGNYYKATLLESTAPSLCNPSPNSTFTMRVDSIRTTRIEGAYTRDRTVENSSSNTHTCNVAAVADAASRIAPALDGDYLDVSCESQDQRKRPVVTRYAYLTHYRYYLPVESTSKYQRSEVSYSLLPTAQPDSATDTPP